MSPAWAGVKSAAPLGWDGAPASTQTGPRIGVVEVKGTIGDGQGGADGDKLVKLIRKYDKDDDIKAVVVRIDSPGGAVAPSQQAYSAPGALRKKKQEGVSMGNLPPP